MRIKLDEGAYEPKRAHRFDAGLDLFSREEVVIPARGSVIIDTGVHVEIPECCAGFLKSKSGLNMKHKITSEGVIDTGYTGSIIVQLYNHGDEPYLVHRGDKITQLVLIPIVLSTLEFVDELDSTERGDKGIGSTGY